MPGWVLVDTHPTQGRTFRRPLDTFELSFFWDGLFSGTADSLQHFELHLPNGHRDAGLFSEDNIVRAWLSTKRRHPLAGATVQGVDGPLRLGTEDGDDDDDTTLAWEPHFIVREHDLAVLRPHEIVFGEVASAEEAQQRAAAIIEGPRLLSETLLVQLHVFHETRADRTDVLHVMALIAHCVTDGAANRTFMRCLLDTLARGPDAEPAQLPLEERLAMAGPSVEQEPLHVRSLSPARRRWRRAIGATIFLLRMRKVKGGQTLPRRLTARFTGIVTPTPARSGYFSTTLTSTETATVIANCRLHGITFGIAYFVLAQVAMARVLYRRYLSGEISEEEWAHRKGQPHITGVPNNLRPYLNKPWLENGGGGEFMASVGFLFYQLPFTPLGTTAEGHGQHSGDGDGIPPFSDFLTFNRFLYRASLARQQATAFSKHPLAFEIVCSPFVLRLKLAWRTARQWMKRVQTASGDDLGNSDKDEAPPATGDPNMAVLAHMWSSLGQLDLASPFEYPLPPAHLLSPYSPVPHPLRAGYVTLPQLSSSASKADTTPRVVVEYARTHLHARPGELYLSAATLRGRMSMYAHHDRNVYEEEVVSEWLDEVRHTVLWYLGQTHQHQ